MKKLPFFPLLLVVVTLLAAVQAFGFGRAFLGLFGTVLPTEASAMAAPSAGLQVATPAVIPVSSAASSPGIVPVTLRDFAIEMPASVPAGSLTFAVTNLGKQPHNFSIVGEGVEHRFVRELGPGESQSMFIILLPGTYQIYSPVDNDRGKGMLATLTITGETAATPGTAVTTAPRGAAATAAPAAGAGAGAATTGATTTPAAGGTAYATPPAAAVTAIATSGAAAGVATGPAKMTPAAGGTFFPTPGTAAANELGSTVAVTPITPIATAGASASAGTMTPAIVGTVLPRPSTAVQAVPGATVAAAGITPVATAGAGAGAARLAGTMTPPAVGTVLPRPSAAVQTVPGATIVATPAVTSAAAGMPSTPAASGTPSGSATSAVAPAAVAGPTSSPNISTPAGTSAGTPMPSATPPAMAAPTAPLTATQPLATSSPGALASGTPVAGPTATAATAGATGVASGTPTATAAAAGGVAQAAGLMPVNTIIGFGVKDSAGKDLGHISELVGSLGTGKVTYAILTSGGILGLGGQSAAVPWELLRLDQGQQAFVVNTDQQTVQQAPGFDPAAIDRGDANWDAVLRTYWQNHGVTLSTSGAGQSPVRVSRLLRSSAKASSEANLGTITSILIAVPPGASGPTPAQLTPTPGNAGPGAASTPGGSAAGSSAGGGATGSTPAESGRFMYAVVGFGGILGFGEQAVPVPWSAFAVDPQTRTFTGKFDEQTFRQAPTIDITKLPQTPSAGWDSAIAAYWSGHLGTP